jgi:hypothetical protein
MVQLHTREAPPSDNLFETCVISNCDLHKRQNIFAVGLLNLGNISHELHLLNLGDRATYLMEYKVT